MSTDLRHRLQSCLEGRACLVGVGNVALGDDAFGVRLAESLQGLEGVAAVVAGTTPERWVERLSRGVFDHVVFLDAVEVSGAPGSAVLLDAGEITAALPQVSTHKLSLGTLARLIEAQSETRVFLLGVVPESLRPGAPLSPSVEASRILLGHLIRSALDQARGQLVGSLRP